MRLTDITVRTLPAPVSGQKHYRDDTLPGFGVRVSPGGTKTFTLMHGRSRQLTTIGRYPIIALADARAEAKRILAEATLGKHRPKRISFLAALELYLETRRQKNRPRSVQGTRYLLHNYFKRLHLMNMEDIAAHHIADITDKLSQRGIQSTAAHAHTAVKTFFKWCKQRHYLLVNPIADLEKPAAPKSRARVLSDGELSQVLSAARELGAFGKYIHVLALTGQRRGEIAALHSAWIARGNFQTITIPAEVAKNNHEHTFPLGAMVSDILDTLPAEGLAFPGRHTGTPMTGFSKPKQELDRKLAEKYEIGHWTLHDLRRTFSTGIARLGVLPHVKEALLNHTTAKSDVERIYDRYTYLPEMRDAISRWENHLKSILAVA
jgi:integrase